MGQRPKKSVLRMQNAEKIIENIRKESGWLSALFIIDMILKQGSRSEPYMPMENYKYSFWKFLIYLVSFLTD